MSSIPSLLYMCMLGFRTAANCMRAPRTEGGRRAHPSIRTTTGTQATSGRGDLHQNALRDVDTFVGPAVHSHTPVPFGFIAV